MIEKVCQGSRQKREVQREEWGANAKRERRKEEPPKRLQITSSGERG